MLRLPGELAPGRRRPLGTAARPGRVLGALGQRGRLQAAPRHQVPRWLGFQRRRRQVQRRPLDEAPQSIAKSNLRTVNTENPAEVVDDYTVKINLTAAGSILSALSDAAREAGIFSKVAHQKLGDDGMNLQAVALTPFLFDQFQSGSQLILRRTRTTGRRVWTAATAAAIASSQLSPLRRDEVGNSDIAQLLRGRDVPP